MIMKLLVATPSNRDHKNAYVRGLLPLAVHLERSEHAYDFNIMRNMSDVAIGRSLLVELAIEKSFSHILFIDDDMGFQVEAFEYLAKRNVDVVGANCVTKSDQRPSARKGQEHIYSKGKSGLEEIDKIGMAFTLLNMDVFKKIERPFFESHMIYHEEKKTITPVGEDTYLCQKLVENKIPIYVDHDAARYVTHIGDFAYQEDFK